MPNQFQKYKISCAHCKKTFDSRLPIEDETAQGSGEVVMECPHCHRKVLVEVLRKHIKSDSVVRSLDPE